MKISEFFLSRMFQLLEVKFSIYLNRRVSVHPRLLPTGNECKCRLSDK